MRDIDDSLLGETDSDEASVSCDSDKDLFEQCDCATDEEASSDDDVWNDEMDLYTDGSDADKKYLDLLIINSVMDAMKIKDDNGCSIKVFEEIMAFGKKLLLSKYSEIDKEKVDSLWPQSWTQIQKLLKNHGYEDAEEYFICFCSKTKVVGTETKVFYTGDWDIMKSENQTCQHCGGKGYIHYHFLGLNSKIKNWFKNETMCEKMLSAWREKNHWLHQEEAWPVKKELWDGDRWRQLQWFWDPQAEWLLPTVSPCCGEVLSTDHILNSDKSLTGEYMVDCSSCFAPFEYHPLYAKGCPLNLALLVHWDGWQPFGNLPQVIGEVGLLKYLLEIYIRLTVILQMKCMLLGLFLFMKSQREFHKHWIHF